MVNVSNHGSPCLFLHTMDDFIATLQPMRFSKKGTRNSKKSIYGLILLLEKLNKIDPELTFLTMLVKQEL